MSSTPSRSERSRVLSALVVAATVIGRAAATPVTAWASHPVGSNETLVLQTYGADLRTPVLLQTWNEARRGWSAGRTVAPANASSSGLTLVLPPSEQLWTAYRVTPGAGPAITVNTAEIWWLLGDAGDFSTPGGWVRLFGRSIRLPSGRGDPSLLELRDQSGKVAARVQMDPTFPNDPYTARFRIPPQLAPGSYQVWSSNGLSPSLFVPMRPFFESSVAPARRGELTVRPPARASWPQRVFPVRITQLPDRPAPSAQQVQQAIQAGLDAAAAAGGGVVYLPPGVYSFTGQINLPANTILKGAGAASTWLTFAAQSMADAPASGYITSNMTGGWGVEDLTIYTSTAGYYYSIFNLQRFHSGVTIRRVIVRAQPFSSQVPCLSRC